MTLSGVEEPLADQLYAKNIKSINDMAYAKVEDLTILRAIDDAFAVSLIEEARRVLGENYRPDLTVAETQVSVPLKRLDCLPMLRQGKSRRARRRRKMTEPTVPEDVASKAVRTCTVCGCKAPKEELCRFVWRDKRPVLDVGKRMAGRGAYCCDRQRCVDGFLGREKKVENFLQALRMVPTT